MNLQIRGLSPEDFIKVIQFMTDEKIDFQMGGDLSVSVGDAPGFLPTATVTADEPITDPTQRPNYKPDIPLPEPGTPDEDPLWRAAVHDNEVCEDLSCKKIEHYGAEPVE